MRARLSARVGGLLRHKAILRQVRSGPGRRGSGLLALLAIGLVVLGAACGGSGGSSAGGTTSSASFVVGSSKFQIDGSGTLSVSVAGVPALTHSGPLGCKG